LSLLSKSRPLRIKSLLRLAQCAEARVDPFVSGMVESLMKQLKRSVNNREVGLLEAPDTEGEVRLEPEQVVVKGDR
jgi:hypothetical protein